MAEIKPLKTQADLANITSQVPDLQTLYFNHVRIATGYYEIRVFMGQQTISAKGEQSILEQVCVAMTPEYAKSFLQILTQQVAKYEEIFGKVRPMPARMIEAMEAMKAAAEQNSPAAASPATENSPNKK